MRIRYGADTIRRRYAPDTYPIRHVAYRGLLWYVDFPIRPRYGPDTAPIRLGGENENICKLWVLILKVSKHLGPKLQTIALKLLGHPSSSSCCERNWSTYNFIHSIKRNKITPERAEDLVFVHSNLRLLSRKRPEYKEGETHMWDVGGDPFDSMDLENAGVLEIANLSLDEPDLEGIIFTQDE